MKDLIKVYDRVRKALEIEVILVGSLAMEIHGLPYESEKQDLDMVILTKDLKGAEIDTLVRKIESLLQAKHSEIEDPYDGEEIGERFFLSFPEGEAQIFLVERLFHETVFRTFVNGIEVYLASPGHIVEAKQALNREKDQNQLKQISDNLVGWKLHL